MDIYTTLKSIEHNVHYLNRYITFIKYCQSVNESLDVSVYTEKHHILPNKLFPQYGKDKSNIVVLTARQHFIAHWILWKAYGKDMSYAFMCMKMICRNKKGRHFNLSSRIFAKLREDLSRWQTGRSFINKFGESKAREISLKLSRIRKGRVHSRKISREQVIEIRTIYRDKSIILDNVGITLGNGKVLTYERALAKYLAPKYNMSVTGMYKIITSKVFTNETQ